MMCGVVVQGFVVGFYGFLMELLGFMRVSITRVLESSLKLWVNRVGSSHTLDAPKCSLIEEVAVVVVRGPNHNEV